MLHQMIEKTMSQFSCFQLWPCCFTSMEVRLLIRDRDGWGWGEEDERVKARPRILPEKDWRDHHQNNGSVKAMSPRHCAATSALHNCCFNCSAGQSHKDNVRCTAVEEQPEAKEFQLSQPSSTSLLMISSGPTWGSSSTSLLLILLFPVIIRIIYLCTVSLQCYGETKGGGGGGEKM